MNQSNQQGVKLLDLVTNASIDLTYVAQRMKSTKEAPGEGRYKAMKMWNLEKRDELGRMGELESRVQRK